MSSTYQPVKCNPSCNCDDEQKQCTYDRRYAEMSSSSGVLGEDIVSFGNESELVPQRAVFGCENRETGDLYSQRADGIMGLGRGQLSIVDQLVDKSVIGDSFSLCYGGMDVGGGAMVLGKITPPPEMVFSHSDPFRSPYYNIELKEMHVAGKRLKLPTGVFDGRHGTVLDSGTTYAYFQKDAFVAFRDAVRSNSFELRAKLSFTWRCYLQVATICMIVQLLELVIFRPFLHDYLAMLMQILREVHSLKRVRGPDPNYDDICFSGAGRDVSQLSKSFPEVEMVFNNGNKLLLSPENYLFRHTKLIGAYCLGIFANTESTTLLGGIVVRNTLVTYDRDNDRIGFLKTNCSELWRRVKVSGAPAPAPSVSQSNDTNLEIPPASAPSGSPANVLPGSFHIGFITLDMSISTNDSKLKLNLKELGQLISKELEVDNSQVRLLNVTSKGNDYLVRWGIFPTSSASYISNSTALSIILRLRDHRLQFPERFGNYKLVEWNAEPQRKSYVFFLLVSITCLQVRVPFALGQGSSLSLLHLNSDGFRNNIRFLLELHRFWWRHHLLAVVLGCIITLSLSAIGIWLVIRHRQQSVTAYEPVASPTPEQELQPLQT
ncbi:hypothetical protein Gohar_017054 [Gossypium harknessii]|uniref:Peptidase A1 domain-containing protein n=1 Tax=Gossypium harknessii TaxID=34285 RepID=A0A7J9G4X6_9ROSI|nr:hypothetical protein [Gossypium harknessii]